MILVNCAWRQDDIIKALESVKIDNQNAFKVVKVEGIRIIFDTLFEDIKGVKMARESIKKIPGYQALVIDVVPVVNNNMFEGYNKLLY
ncbi:hypothetical protein [Clostridium chromiireducens]|uniref:Uncharacterized protein n=1 Tax=Clostridium chromiireducens TaxID=225345 RepID=A0A1V4IWV4_9CLOT|nr:hypothetical protein [Clostridium chromiireducens]MVX66389.1 hypothetical protein [Clostridium chromiireducens]OPJ64310.1 hypothetical protein CLCHR_12810 [Clostridium chromiireducens]RII32341.1 hypothetical protein D2A34_24285 [Clostridium chromiireducens]